MRILFAILFADDSNFFCTGNNLPSLIGIVNSELTIIVSWLNTSKMSLNIEKTSYLIIRSRNKKLDKADEISIFAKLNKFKLSNFLEL